MLSKESLDIFYYVTPLQYRNKLDGDRDPKEFDNIARLFKLREIITSCSLTEYIQFIIRLLLDKYANEDFLYSVSATSSDDYTELEIPRRKDIAKIHFDFIEHDPEGEEERDFVGFLEKLSITFKDIQPQLVAIIEAELSKKTYEKIADGSFVIQNSPIMRIEVGLNTLELHLDRNWYIDYRTR